MQQLATLNYPSPSAVNRQLPFKFQHTIFHAHRKKLCVKISALKSDGSYDGKLIDENMIILRKRIQEMKNMTETSSREALSGWMEWEKHYYNYGGYNSDVCKTVGVLQSVLMNSRPSLALGMAAIFMLSVPTSFMVILFNLWGWINGFHL